MKRCIGSPVWWILAIAVVPGVYSEPFQTFVFNFSHFEPYYFQCGDVKCRGIEQYCDGDNICRYCNEGICRSSESHTIGQCQIMCQLHKATATASTGEPGNLCRSGKDDQGTGSDVWGITAAVMTVLLVAIIIALLICAYQKGLFGKDKKEEPESQRPILSIPTDHHLTHPEDAIDQSRGDQTGLKV